MRAIADAYVGGAGRPRARGGAGPRAGRTGRCSPTSDRPWLLERYELQGRTAAALDALPRDAGDETLRAALRERLERERLLFDTGFTPRLIAGLASPVHLIRYSFEGSELTPDAAGARLLARLRAVPAAVDAVRRHPALVT